MISMLSLLMCSIGVELCFPTVIIAISVCLWVQVRVGVGSDASLLLGRVMLVACETHPLSDNTCCCFLSHVTLSRLLICWCVCVYSDDLSQLLSPGYRQYTDVLMKRWILGTWRSAPVTVSLSLPHFHCCFFVFVLFVPLCPPCGASARVWLILWLSEGPIGLLV